MSIWNKVLLGFIFVFAVAFFYLAARTLKTHQYWCELAQQFEQKIEQVENENVDLVQADPKDDADVTAMGIDRLRLELHKMLIDRGRVWADCTPQVQPQTGKVTLTLQEAGSHGIADKTVLYAFEGKDVQDGGKYLGEFKVVGVDEDKVALEPAVTLEPDELKRIDDSQGPWTVYEIMPVDSHSVFTRLDEDTKKQMLPQSTVAEYVKDGEAAQDSDLAAWGVEGTIEDGKYVRPLRDYDVLFKYFQLQRSVLADLIESTTRDKQYVEDAVADAQKQVQFRQTEVTGLTSDRNKYVREQDAVAAHRRVLEATLLATQRVVQDLITRNLAIAGQIAKIQASAKLQIDGRSSGMVETAPGRS